MFLQRCGCVPVCREGPYWGMGRAGTLSWLSSQALLEGKGSGGQLGQHSQSISSKQGKLIPGQRMLLLGANTTLQLEPDTAVQSLWTGHCRTGISTGRQAVAGVKAEFLCCP